MSGSGRVIFIGASSAGLVSRIGLDRIASADVVICDRLIDSQVLAGVEDDKIVYVGKSCGGGVSQDEINRLMSDYAKRGKVVARVKGGDVLIFSRGGEEMERLDAEGIDYEIVPGVTSASLAGAYSGIPLTHRSCSSSVCFVAGHNRDGIDDEFRGLVCRRTIVLYMSLGQLRSNMERLIRVGLDRGKSVAVVENAGSGLQRVVEGTVGTIADVCDGLAERLEGPAVVIIGDVVEFRKGKSWFERKPLFGQVVVITRPGCRTWDFYDRLVDLGAYVLSVPGIEYEDINDYEEFDAGLEDIFAGLYDWIVFTSRKGAEVFFDRLGALKRDIRDLGNIKVGVIGPMTRKVIEGYMVRPEVMPDEYTSLSLGKALLARESVGRSAVLIRSSMSGADELSKVLREGGWRVNNIVGYVVKVKETINPVVLEHLRSVKRVDWIMFTSSSIVSGFWGLVERYGLGDKFVGAKNVSIGPVTTSKLVEMGKEVFAEAKEHTIDGMIRMCLGRG